MRPLAVSALVLTYNEEANLPRCLQSLSWCDDIVVLDSFSTDATVNIAHSAKARVIQRRFDDYARQRNHGLKEITYKHPWVLMIDADEVVPAELVDEMRDVLASCKSDTTLYRMRRKDYLLGRWLKHSTNYSTLWFGRLMRPESVYVKRSINEEYHTDGKIGYMSQNLIHYPFNKGFHAWFDKHNRYSSMEAELKAREHGADDWTWRNLMHQDPVMRRKTLKLLVYSLPARPMIMFIGRYILSGGILDGRAGLTFCALKTYYEYMIDCKVRELNQRKRNLPV
jgi:glycosyltransferase involved in cell wall biosynthesis